MSRLVLEEVPGAAAGLEAEVLERLRCHRSATRRALQEPHLEKVGFVDVLEGPPVLAEGRSQGTQAHRATIIDLDDGRQEATIEVVEAVGVDLHLLETPLRRFEGDCVGPEMVGKVANATQQPVGDTGCAARASSDLLCGIVGDADVEDSS